MSHHARDERHDLVDTMRELGSQAPTLCDPWLTAELAAHLVLRESSLRAMAASARTASLIAAADAARAAYVSSHSFDEILGRLGGGPPWYSPFAIRPLGEKLNLLEFVVHHEDVRRAQPDFRPRAMPIARQLAIWNNLRTFSKLSLRAAPVGVRLVWDGRDETQPRKPVDGQTVTVTGDPVELTLVAFGRQRAARVTYSGGDDVVARFLGTTIKV